MRITNTPYSLRKLVDVILSYIELIIPFMMKNNTSMLNYSAIDLLRTNIDKKSVSIRDLKEMADHLQQQYQFTEEQQDLLDVIMNELQKDRIRRIVIKPLLKPFQELFNETIIESQVYTFTNLVWYYLHSGK
jgi:hypothetical protein